MSIKAAIKAKVEAASSGLACYYGHAPQQRDYPYAVFNRIGGQNEVTQGGRTATVTETFQLDLFDDSDADLETRRNAVLKALHGPNHETWSNVFIYSSTVVNQVDNSELENDGGQTAIARHTLDVTIKYRLD